MLNKQNRLKKVQYKLSKCSKVVAAVAIGGIAFSLFPFIVGAPDFDRRFKGPEHHRGEERGDKFHGFMNYFTGPPPPRPENPNAQREQDREDFDRFDY